MSMLEAWERRALAEQAVEMGLTPEETVRITECHLRAKDAGFCLRSMHPLDDQDSNVVGWVYRRNSQGLDDEHERLGLYKNMRRMVLAYCDWVEKNVKFTS